MRELGDERAYRRTGLRAQRAERTRGVARDRRILVVQRLSQRRLNPLCIRGQVNQGISGVAAEGHFLMTEQFNEQRNGRRTDPPDDLDRPPLQILIATVEELFQQRQRTSRPTDQGGFGDCPDLRVFGREAIGPVLRH